MSGATFASFVVLGIYLVLGLLVVALVFGGADMPWWWMIFCVVFWPIFLPALMRKG